MHSCHFLSSRQKCKFKTIFSSLETGSLGGNLDTFNNPWIYFVFNSTVLALCVFPDNDSVDTCVPDSIYPWNGNNRDDLGK